MAAPPSSPGSASACRQSLRSPRSSRPACGWSSAENPEGTQKVAHLWTANIHRHSLQWLQILWGLCRKIELSSVDSAALIGVCGCVCVHWHSLSRLGCVLSAARRERERKGHVRGGRMRIHNLITLLPTTDQPTWRELDPHWVHYHADYSPDGSSLCSVGIQAGYSAVNEPVHTEGLLHAGEDELRPPVSH